MAENQNIEYKESWRTEYLKWLCGFANAQGGTIYIGVNDKGEVVGLPNAKKLMEDIPNQVQAGLGIMPDVSLLEKDGKDYIAIKVEPSAFPVSYHGEFHYRSGSTKQLLTGNALSAFIMRRTGFRWEDVTVDDVTVDDLDSDSFKIFRREALRSKRMTQEDLDISNEELLNKLHLMADGKLKRSAVLLFHSDPSRVQVGSYVKIGRFSGNADLLYQDVLEDSLIKIADKVIDLIYLKYLKAKITYEHDRRVETYPFARDAIREAVYNAIAHNCYMFGTPIQIRIEDEAIIISNRCILPENWTVETLMEPHESIPYNENIANAFYYAGYIETWGRGIQKICNACTDLGAAKPRYELLGTGLRVHFAALKSALFNETQEQGENRLGENIIETTQKTTQKTGTKTGTKNREKILNAIKESPNVTLENLMKICELSRNGVRFHINLLKAEGVISRVNGQKGGHWEINESAVEISDGRLGEKPNEWLGEKLGEKPDEWLGEKLGEKSDEWLGENRLTILRCLTQNPSMSTRRLAELLGMSTTAMDKNIKWLKENGIIRHVGPAKGGRWEVII